eukprot:gene15438-21525_t
MRYPLSRILATLRQDPLKLDAARQSLACFNGLALQQNAGPSTQPPQQASFRSKHYTANYAYNLIQDVDTNLITQMLKKATAIEDMVQPVITHSKLLDPFQKLPRMALSKKHRLRKMGRADSNAFYTGMMKRLAERFSVIMGDCTNDQLVRGLWGLGMARLNHESALMSASVALSSRLHSLDGKQLSTVAWALAATGYENDDVLASIAARVATAQAAGLSTSAIQAEKEAPKAEMTGWQRQKQQAKKEALKAEVHHYRQAAPAPGSEEVAEAAEVVAEKGLELDHRSIIKLAWAFAEAGVQHPPANEALSKAATSLIAAQLQHLKHPPANEALSKAATSLIAAQLQHLKHPPANEALSKAATSLIAAQLQVHDPESGPLQPRRTFMYRTVRGWVSLDAPRKPRPPSKYMRKDGPTIVVRDFEVGSLAGLVLSFGRLGHLDTDFMRAVGFHASMSLDVDPPPPPAPVLLTVAGGRTISVADISDLGTSGPPLKPWTPAPPASTAASVLSMLNGCRMLGYKDPSLASSFLAKVRMMDFSSKKLVSVIQSATAMGLVSEPSLASLFLAKVRMMVSSSKKLVSVIQSATAMGLVSEPSLASSFLAKVRMMVFSSKKLVSVIQSATAMGLVSGDPAWERLMRAAFPQLPKMSRRLLVVLNKSARKSRSPTALLKQIALAHKKAGSV